MFKTFKYRLFTNKTQEDKLLELFDTGRYLYNCALEHRIHCWKQLQKSISLYDQIYSLKEIRKLDENLGKLNSNCCAYVLRQLDEAYQAFFRRVKKGEKPGFPRFKGKDRFHSLTFTYGDGIKIKNKKLYVQNVGHIRIKLHRQLESIVKTVTIKKQNGHFYACFSCDQIPRKIVPSSNKEIGIDVGIKSFVVFSNSTSIDNPKFLKQSETRLKQIQSVYSKKKTKKTRKILIKLHQKIKNQRKDFQHKLSRKIINEFSYIFVEDLKPQQMLKDNKVLNKYISDAAWGSFLNMLSYKAEEADRTIVKVNPRNTSKVCSSCGELIEKDLSVRVHKCPFCNFTADRDHNAALNIHRLGRSLISTLRVRDRSCLRFLTC